MRPTLQVVAAAAVVVAAGSAASAFFGDSEQGHRIGEAFAPVSAALGSDPVRGRDVAKVEKILTNVDNERLLATELASAKRLAQFSATKFADQQGFADAIRLAIPDYVLDLEEVRAGLTLGTTSGLLPAADLKRVTLALARFEHAMPDPVELSQLPPAAVYARLAAAAKATTGYGPLDSGTWPFFVQATTEPTQLGSVIDLDGDGDVEGSADISATGYDMATLIRRGIVRFQRSPAIVLWGTDLAQKAPLVLVGLANVRGGFAESDADFDRYGHPLLRTASSIAGGRLKFSFEGDAVPLGANLVAKKAVFDLVTATSLGRRAPKYFGQEIHGNLNAAIPPGVVIALIEFEEFVVGHQDPLSETMKSAVRAAADVDTDGDGAPDALSVVLGISAPHLDTIRPALPK